MIFHNIRWRNFLSTGNGWSEIILDDVKTTVISGVNGAGKSTFLDALTFLLFNKPFRDINKPSLMNSINNKDCLVEGTLTVGSKLYRIVRGMKPNIFEIHCDGVLIDQSALAKDYQEYLEEFILKMNFRSFNQIIVLGSATYVPFMKLKAADKRSIIEDLLDIKVFSSMNVIVKQKLSEIKDALKENKTDQDLLAVKIISTKRLIEEIKNNNEAKVRKAENELAISNGQVTKLLSDVSLVEKHITQIQRTIQDASKVRKKYESLEKLFGTMKTKIGKLEREVQFYTDYDMCPTCQQKIEEDFRSLTNKAKTTKITELDNAKLEIEKEMDICWDRRSVITSVEKKISDHNVQLIKYNNSITQLNRYMDKIRSEIRDAGSFNGSALDQEQKNLDEMFEKEIALGKNSERLVIDRHYYDVAATLLKDTGIKTRIISKYLPIINKLINKYLSDMNFFVNFTLDENFDESIKSRFRDEFSYGNFSEGEKLRIDVALMLAWREIAKMKNSVSTNLLIMDEILDRSLDFGGTDILVNILNSFDEKTNIFIISPKPDIIADKFERSIKFEKKGNFSVRVE